MKLAGADEAGGGGDLRMLIGLPLLVVITQVRPTRLLTRGAPYHDDSGPYNVH